MSNREYPERPLVGVGGVVIDRDRVLLVRRGSEPLRGEWSIPGGLLEIGETITEGVAREILEETGLSVRVVDVVEVLDRIDFDNVPGQSTRVRFHYVILDYLCERLSGDAVAGGDATDVAWATEEELPRYALRAAALRVIGKAFALARARA